MSSSCAVEDAFCLRRALYFLPTPLECPEQSETSPQLTRLKLSENRAIHDFLFRLAGGLQHFQLIQKSAARLFAVHCGALGARYISRDPEFDINELTMKQAVYYSVRTFRVYARGPLNEEIVRAVGAARIEE